MSFRAFQFRVLYGYSKRLVRWKSSTPEREKFMRCRRDADLTICLMEEGSIDPTYEQPRVVIIGAGMAGLSAANRLLQCGVDNFVILEATDRPGGRIHTCSFGNSICELGPDKIYGASPTNPIHNLASREGLLSKSSRVQGPRPITMTSSGYPVPRLVEATAEYSMSLIKEQAVGLKGHRAAKGKSLWDFVSTRIQQEVELYPPVLRQYAARKMFGLTNELRNFIGTDLAETALNQYGCKCGAFGPRTTIPTGMVGILAPLLRPMPSCDHILYCKQVDKIIWSPNLSAKPDRVKVICCDSTVYQADYVIVTLPLGVLKEKAGSMFSPGLNDEKVNAINKIGFGNICKITLEYERPFWVWKSGEMLCGWTLAELKSRKSCPDWVKGIGLVEETAGSQQGLSFRVAGQEADIAEGLSDVRIAEDFTRLMRRFTGDSTLPYPANILKSAWKSNKFTKGAVPYFGMQSEIGHLCELAMPLPEETKGVPSVMFAGDFAMPTAMGTLHGARQSGVREADRILRLTKQLAGRPRPDAAEAEACQLRSANIAVKN